MLSLSLAQKDAEKRDKYDSIRVTQSMLDSLKGAGSRVPVMSDISLWSEGPMVPREGDNVAGQERHWDSEEVLPTGITILVDTCCVMTQIQKEENR